MKKYDKKKLVPIYTLHNYYGSFVNLYGCINYKDAYKIITKFHPELSMEEFVDDLIKQANDIKPFRYFIALEGKDDFWIYDNISWEPAKHININDKSPQRIYLCSQDDYERVYTGKYSNKEYTIEGQAIRNYINEFNPDVTIQRLRMWHCTAIDFNFKKDPNEILIKLKESNCIIPNEKYFLELLNGFYDTYKYFGENGRSVKQIRENDVSNSLDCVKPLKLQNKIGFLRIYQIANACTNLYLVFDHNQLAKVVSNCFPQYTFEQVLDEVVEAMQNFKIVSKNFRRYTFKAYKVSKKDSYFSNDKYSFNYIIIDNRCPNCETALFYMSKVFQNANYYIPKDLNECVSFIWPKWEAYKKYLEPIERNIHYDIHYDSHYSGYDITRELALFSTNLRFSKQKFIDIWSNCMKLKNEEVNLLIGCVNEFYDNVRLPSYYGHTRKEAYSLGIEPNYDIDHLNSLIVETIIDSGWW